MLNYKIRPLFAKIFIFREKQCSKFINILLEFIAGVLTVSIKRRQLIFEIVKLISEILISNFEISINWNVPDDLSSSWTQEISTCYHQHIQVSINTYVTSCLHCYKSRMIRSTSREQLNGLIKLLTCLLHESWLLINNHESIICKWFPGFLNHFQDFEVGC